MLISPLIKPGTVSGTYYNHYSWLRTMEDLLPDRVRPARTRLLTLVAGTVCGGLDGEGHIGYAAQPGLADFGPDVFTAQSYVPVHPLAAPVPLAGGTGAQGRLRSMHSARRAAERNVGRALEPGPLRAVAALLLAATALAGCGGGSKYPSFLPKSTLDPKVDAALTGTMARPAFTVEGLPVDVRTRAFDVSVTVSGPIVPGRGPALPAAGNDLYLDRHDEGRDGRRPGLAARTSTPSTTSAQFLVPGLVPGERRPPSILHPGQVLTFQLRAYQLVGQGTMQWAPDHRHVVAIWDYEVEND